MPFARAQNRVPVTIITGFLGAGKTSLVNYLLKEKQGKRFAVVENEFGEVDIDRHLVSDNLLEKEDLVSLENGCVCCSLRKDIVKAFAEIEKRSCQRGTKHDAILLETTGLADPAPVAFTFFANPWMASRFRLDSILCVVDARHLLLHLDAPKPANAINEAVQQIAFSDTILLNKTDLVTEAQKAEIIAAIRHINRTATLVECQLNNPERCPKLDQVVGVNSFSVNRALELDPGFLDSDSDSDSEPSSSSSPSTSGTDHAAAERRRARDARRKQRLHKLNESEQQDTQATSTSDSTVRGNNNTSGHKRPASGDTSNESGSSGARGSGDNSNMALGSGAGLLEPDAPQSKHTHPHGPDCECCNHQERDLREGERQPKKPRKKLHDLSDVSSVGLTVHGELDDYRFNMFMRDLLYEKAKDIYRCKGVLAVAGHGNQKFVFQGVHETICYGPAEQPWKEDEPKVNKIVFIGRGLDRKALVEGLRTCVRATVAAS